MDSKTNIEELKNSVHKFCDEREWSKFDNLKDLGIVLIAEAAELLEIFRYKSNEEIEEILNGEKRIKVEEELSDVMFNLLRFSYVSGIDISTAFYNKLEKNAIKYPIDKCRGTNKKYNEL